MGGDLAARVPEPPSGDDELARLIGSVNAMAASLERAWNTEREFLLFVSHDLRTPLTSISGWAEALTDSTAPDPSAAGADHPDGGRSARPPRPRPPRPRPAPGQAFTLTTRPVDLRDVATGTAEALHPDLEDAGLTPTLDLAEDAVVVDGDADRLAQIAADLIENAGRHATSRVRISVSEDGADDAVLAVEDDGPGTPREEADRVFDRLYGRARPTAAYRGRPPGWDWPSSGSSPAPWAATSPPSTPIQAAPDSSCAYPAAAGRVSGRDL